MNYEKIETSRLLTSREAAAMLGISERTLWTLKDQGEIPHIKIGRSVRYSVTDLNAWINQQRIGGVK